MVVMAIDPSNQSKGEDTMNIHQKIGLYVAGTALALVSGLGVASAVNGGGSDYTPTATTTQTATPPDAIGLADSNGTDNATDISSSVFSVLNETMDATGMRAAMGNANLTDGTISSNSYIVAQTGTPDQIGEVQNMIRDNPRFSTIASSSTWIVMTWFDTGY